MAIVLNDNIRVSAGKPSEPKYLNLSNAPYTGTSQVFAQIPIGERHNGLTVKVLNNEYWFYTGLTNSNLVLKSVGDVITGATNGLSTLGKNVVLGGVITATTNVSLGVGTGYTRVDFNHTDNNIAIEYNTEIDYDQPFNGAKIGVDSGGIFVAQNNYQTPQRGSVPYIRDEDGHMAFQGLTENEVYTVDASGNPKTIGLGNLDPWLTGGTFISQGNISIQGGEFLEYSLEFNLDSFNAQAVNNISLQSGSLLNLQSNTINISTDEKVTLNANIYNAGIIVGAIDGDSIGIQLQLGDNVTPPETGALFYQNEFAVLDSINPTVDGDVLTIVGGLPTWSSSIITGATNGLSVDNGNVILGGDFSSANLNNLSGDAVFQINIGEETVTNKHSLYLDTTQFYLQSIGTSGNTRNYNLSQNFTADGFEQLIFVAKDDIQISNSTGYLTLNNGVTIAATDNLADVITSFNLTETGITLTDNRSVKKGIEYAGNYSSGFTSRSIPDVEWVLSQVSSGSSGGGTITGATNGLSIQSGKIVLGGTLTGNTLISVPSSNRIQILNTTGRDHGININEFDVFVGSDTASQLGANTFTGFKYDGTSTIVEILVDSVQTIRFNNEGTVLLSNLVIVDEFDTLSIKDNRTLKSGIKYFADYSSGYTALSIPNVGWITGNTSVVTITGATNGLSIQSGNVVLGGTLTGYTTIEGADGFALLSGDVDNGAFNEISTTVENDFSYGALISKNNSISGNTAESSVQTISNLSGSTLLLAATSSSEDVSILLKSDYNEGSILVGVLDNNLGFKGIQYKDDYSTDFGPRSIPDVAWVLSQVSSGGTGGGTVTGATNGLNIDNNNVRLGGNLSGYTQLQLDGDYTTFQLYSPMGVTGVTKFGTYFSDGFQCSTGIQQANDNITINVNSNTISASMKFDGISGITINGGAMRYITDYSSGFTSLSIPNVGWITGLTSGGSVNVSNGLSKSGNTIVLGGSLTGNTTIATNGNEFVIGDPFGTGNYLGLNFLGYGFITENQTNPQGITIGNYSGITSINHNDPNEIFDISSTSLLRIHTSDNGLTPVQGIEISAADKGYLYLESIDGFERTYLRISSTGDTIFHDDRNVGLKYADNYSSNYDSRSIPDVEWVTNFVTDGLTANNGLVKVGTTISLGGELTGDTSIRGGGLYSLNFGGDGSDITTNRINQFNVNARNTVLRSASDSFATALIELGTGGDDSSVLLSTSGIGTASLLMQQQSGNASFLVTGSGSFKGFEYADDYSTNFGPRSIPDVDWITGRTVTVGNGLTISGSTVILGGNLVTVTELSIGFGSAFGVVSDNITPIDIDPNQAQFYTNFYTPTASLQSSITQSLNSINFSSINNTGSTSSNLSISNSGEASLNGTKSLFLDSSNGLVTINSLSGVTITGAQAKYDNDYSSSYTDRSIIDKAYALGLVETEISLSSSSGEISPNKINYLGLYDTSSSALTIDLPTTPINKSTVKIKDRTGNASSNNLTINGNGRTIDGSSTALINTNYGCIEFIYFDVTDEWFIIGMVI